MYKTINRGPDGFGSQMLAQFLGYLNSLRDGCKYCYSTIRNINLVNVGESNEQLPYVNSVVDRIWLNLGVPSCEGKKYEAALMPYHEVSEETFREEYLNKLRRSWPLLSPFDPNTFNIVIHIRRGGDISKNVVDRWTSSEYYNKLIPKLLKAYPEAIIHTVSWEDPELNSFELGRVIHHISNKGDEFIKHYNMLVHADMLFLASSSFSSSAALFNKNKILLDSNIMLLTSCPTAERWSSNFKNEEKLWEER